MLDLFLSHIADLGTTLADVVIMAVSSGDTGDSHPAAMHHVFLRIEDLLETLHGHELIHKKVSAWAHTVTKRTYVTEIHLLTRPDASLHYIARGITENKLREFDIDDITEWMSTNAPRVWNLLDGLLTADPHLQHKQDWAQKQAQEVAAMKRRPRQGNSSNSHDIDMQASTDHEEYWEFLDQSVPIIEEDEDEPEDILDQVEQ